MARIFFVSLCLLWIVSLAAQATDLPDGLRAGSLLFEWPGAKGASENEWKLENPEEGRLDRSGAGLEITSGQTNLILTCNAVLTEPLVMRITMRFDETRNDWMHVQLFDRISLGFARRRQGFVLRAKRSGTIYDDGSYEELGVKEFDPKANCPAWPQIILTVALTSGQISAWCEGNLLFQEDIERFQIPVRGMLRIRSGWHSAWGIEKLEAWELKDQP